MPGEMRIFLSVFDGADERNDQFWINLVADFAPAVGDYIPLWDCGGGLWQLWRVGQRRWHRTGAVLLAPIVVLQSMWIDPPAPSPVAVPTERRLVPGESPGWEPWLTSVKAEQGDPRDRLLEAGWSRA